MSINLLSGFRRVADIFGIRLEGETVNLEHLDSVQLKQAYRELAGMGPIVDALASFILAGGVTVECEDETAGEVCQSFIDRNVGSFRRACRESCLYGYIWLLPIWDEDRSRLRVFSPKAVTLEVDPDRPWVIKQAVIRTTFDRRRLVQTISADEYTIEVEGRVTDSGRNQLGLIPIVPVHLNRLSDDLFGTSVISDALYLTLREKALLRAKGIKIEKRQSSLLAIAGVKGFEALKTKLAQVSSGETVPGIYLPDPKGSVQFVESRRGPEGVIELLKMLYHDAIVDGRVPEYLLGVGMPSAQASTREQRVVIEGVVSPLRSDWGEAFERLNRVVLRLHEVHEIKSFSTNDTTVAFGPLFEKDAAAEADTLQKKSAALVQLHTLGILSRETAQEAIPKLIPDVEREKERLAADRENVEPYPNPPSPSPAQEEDRDESEPEPSEPAE